ncbi:MAG: putative LysR-family transcriptional regulator [Acidimicrobiaceae bacterium]|nr:putative LysR-family transcriptional regulator [Acidimicrobiaceae bacterium]
MIDVQRLRALRAVIERGSIAGAAAELAYTPSAVSQQISALERETGLTLFRRTGRGIRPTPEAAVLLEHGLRVLEELGELDVAVQALRKGATGRMRVASFPTASATGVPVAVADFSAKFPAIQVELSISETDLVFERIADGSTDVAVIVVPFDQGLGHPGRIYQHLLTDEFFVTVHAEHPLASRCEIELQDLRREPWIATGGNPKWCPLIVLEACREAGFEPRYVFEGDEYGMTQGLVASGLGVALVPGLALAGGQHPGTVCRPLAGVTLHRKVYAVTRSASRPVYVDAFVESLEKAFGEYKEVPKDQMRSA